MLSDSTGHLQPRLPPSPKNSSPSTSNIPDISPIAPSSNGTDTTDIDDTTIEEDGNSEATPQLRDDALSPSTDAPLKVSNRLICDSLMAAANACQLKTKDSSGNDFRPGSSEEDLPSSVIHAPKGFEAFVSVLRASRYVRMPSNGCVARSKVTTGHRPVNAYSIPKIRHHRSVSTTPRRAP